MKLLGIAGIVKDIAWQSRVESALRKSQDKLQKIFDSVAEGILVTGPGGIITEANTTIIELGGFSSRNQLIGKHALELVADRDRPKAREDYRKVSDGGRVLRNREYSLVKADGAEFTGEVNLASLSGTARQSDGVIMLVRDVTERKQAERQLREGEEKYHSLFDNMTEAFALSEVILDEDGKPRDNRIVEVNKAWEELIGIPREKAIGRTNLELLPQTEPHWIEILGNVGLSGKPALSERYSKPLGKWLEIYAYSPKKGYVARTVRDITSRKETEEALKQSEERHRALFSAMSDGFGLAEMILDGNGKPYDYRLLEVNEVFGKLTGFPPEVASGKTMRELFPDIEPCWIETYGKVALTGKPARFERFSNSLGKWFDVSAYSPRKGYFVHIFKDITEQKHLREMTQRYLTEITRAHEAERKRVSRDLHDDIIQPLASLLFDIESMGKGDSIHDLPAVKGLLADKVSDVLKKIRRFAHELRPDILDRLGLVPALELLAAELSEEGITAGLEVSGTERRLSPEVEVALFRIAQEALRNVKKHSGAKEAWVKVDFQEHKLGLHVIDNGRGFEQPGYISDYALAGKLGLTGIQERVRLHNGALSIASQPSKGTSIAIELELE